MRTTVTFDFLTCSLQVTDYQKVIVDTALQELRTTFLWQEALCDGIEETLPNLGAHVIEEISKSAVKNSVYLHMSEEGKYSKAVCTLEKKKKKREKEKRKKKKIIPFRQNLLTWEH